MLVEEESAWDARGCRYRADAAHGQAKVFLVFVQFLTKQLLACIGAIQLIWNIEGSCWPVMCEPHPLRLDCFG